MYTLFKNSSAKQLLTSEMPALGVSLVIAELFYKFGSFTLECLTFLATWWVISFVFSRLKSTKSQSNNRIIQ